MITRKGANLLEVQMEPNITMMEVEERAPHSDEVLIGASLVKRAGNSYCPIPYVIDYCLSSEAAEHVRFSLKG